MIDHIDETSGATMNVLGRLAAGNELLVNCGQELVRQTRRLSANGSLGLYLNQGESGASNRFANLLATTKRSRLSTGNRPANLVCGSSLRTPLMVHREPLGVRKLNGTSPQQPLAGQPPTNGKPVAEPAAAAAGKPSVRFISEHVREYIESYAKLTNARDVYICDGSEAERDWIIKRLQADGMIKPLAKYDNCWLARTDPRDVARVESRTFICTRNKRDVVPQAEANEHTNQTKLGNWMHLTELDERMATLLAGCMSGRTMYVIPFSMGPLGSSLSKLGVELTDSAYVVASMHIMARVSRKVLQLITQRADGNDFVRCFHSVGCPLDSNGNTTRPVVNNWPCNPEQTIITHIPERREIISYGSGYGGNSLLGKKCFALRLGSILGQQEGWLAEHMLILGVTNPSGVKKYVAAAFPSACGKTNLAMMTPSLPGYKIECVGDDIAWMRFDSAGQLRAINPEAGFFGVAPGTNNSSNPNAMRTIERNTIFTNVAETSDGDFFWEGLERERSLEGVQIKDWQDNDWQPKQPGGAKAAHPNSRFCAPAAQCPIIDPEWESDLGVPISAIIFGGRRPDGVPLVYESFDWQHGVFVGAAMRSESTAAAEHQGKTIMHDPFAMRPFFGYNFGKYLEHWLSFGSERGAQNLKLPKIFHVNWFRKSSATGEFLWPGFGENSRVLDWICRRVDGDASIAQPTPIGLIPTREALNLNGLEQPLNLDELFEVSTDFWLEEQRIIERYLVENVGQDLPAAVLDECRKLKSRLAEQRARQADQPKPAPNSTRAAN